ncbi:AAA family ATPase [Nocardia sp. CA-136227]|uniref:AAA family ATPase n=1 Tax=Nocardia sp. CA-136227 TaxID=3239979 RepID=UPI003D965D76
MTTETPRGPQQETGSREHTEVTSTEPTGGTAPAEYLWPAQVALMADFDPDDYVEKFPDATVRKAIFTAHFKFDHERPFTFRDCEVPVRVGAVDHLIGETPSRAEAAADAVDLGLDDPHEVMARLKRQRAERFRDRDKRKAVEKAERAATMPEMALFDFDRDFAQLTAPVALIPGLIATGSAVQVIAEPNVGKTFLALGWACDLASRGSAVVYVVADDSTYQFVRRVLGWCAAHDAQPRDIFRYLQLFTRAAQFADDTDISALAALVRERAAVLVVFDTQHQCSEGLDENSNNDSRAITAALVRLTKLGPAVALVHHTGDGKTGRGAKSVHGYLTTVLSVTEVEQEGGRYLQVRATKQKNMERGNPVLYPLERVEIPEDMRAGVIADADAWTLVARTRMDPFDVAGGDRGGLISDIRMYCALAALRSSPNALPVTKVAKYMREAAKPMLAAKGLLPVGGRLPKGFTDQAVSTLLMSMAKVPEGAVEGLAAEDSTTRITYYDATEAGEAEAVRLAEALGIRSENME